MPNINLKYCSGKILASSERKETFPKFVIQVKYSMLMSVYIINFDKQIARISIVSNLLLKNIAYSTSSEV